MKAMCKKSIEVGIAVWAIPTGILSLISLLLNTVYGRSAVPISAMLAHSITYFVPLGISSAIAVAFSFATRKPKGLLIIPFLSFFIAICMIPVSIALIDVPGAERVAFGMFSIIFALFSELILGAIIAIVLYFKLVIPQTEKNRWKSRRIAVPRTGHD